MDDDIQILLYIKKRCYEDRSFLYKIIQAATEGIVEYANQQEKRAADMESFAYAMAFIQKQDRLSPKLKKDMNNLALSKLEKWLGKTSIKWDTEITQDGAVNGS